MNLNIRGGRMVITADCKSVTLSWGSNPFPFNIKYLYDGMVDVIDSKSIVFY